MFSVDAISIAVSAGAHNCASSQMAMHALGISSEEREAMLLRERDGMNDSQIAAIQGIRRETACRRRARIRSKLNHLRRICTGEQCPVLEALTSR
jgi:DNA-directed RNA polymerase specialized sigma24 family protein